PSAPTGARPGRAAGGRSQGVQQRRRRSSRETKTRPHSEGGLGEGTGAEAGTRTLTGVLPLRPERSASTNSATSARRSYSIQPARRSANRDRSGMGWFSLG